jgi:hypothetical protein
VGVCHLRVFADLTAARQTSHPVRRQLPQAHHTTGACRVPEEDRGSGEEQGAGCDEVSVYYPDHVEKISDPEFMKSVRAYLAETAQLYEELSAVRMPAAKHELPKKPGQEVAIADGPGMGLPSPYTGSIGWPVVLGDKETTIVRRDLADKFFGIMAWHEDVETALVLAKQAKGRRKRRRGQLARQSRRPMSDSGPLS